MTCPSEFICALYADGELAEVESRDVRIHLESCNRCHSLIESLIEENRLLCSVFQQELMPEVTESRLSLRPLVAYGLGLSALLRTTSTLIQDFSIPAALQWLNPLDLSGQLNLLVSGISFAARGGVESLMSAFWTFALIAGNAALLTAAFRLLRKRTGVATLAFIIGFGLLVARPTYAAEVRRSGPIVTIGANETLDNTLIAAGESITIDGTVTGDVIATGRNVSIRGVVKGDLIGFAQNVQVIGTVEGNVFGFGQNVLIRGKVLRNVYGMGELVEVGRDATVGGSAMGFCSTMTIDGDVVGDTTSYANVTNIHGSVGRHLDVRSGRIVLFSGASVAGDFNAQVKRPEDVEIQSGASILGKQNVQVEPPAASRYMLLSFYIRQLLWLIGALLTGLLMFWLLPSLASVRLDTGNAILRAAGFGFLIAVATPIAVVILAITVVGVPIAIISIAAWLLLLYLAKIVIAQFVGRALLGNQGAVSLLLGLAFVVIAINVPYIGGIVNVLLTVLGFGATILEIRGQAYRSPNFRSEIR